MAGPLAGVLRMHWKTFALFNFLGAVTWVTVIASLGYLFGSQLDRLLATMKHVELALLVLLLIGIAMYLWRRKKRNSSNGQT